MQQWGGFAFRLEHLCFCLGLEGEHAPKTLSITKGNVIILILPLEDDLSFNFLKCFHVLQSQCSQYRGVFDSKNNVGSL